MPSVRQEMEDTSRKQSGAETKQNHLRELELARRRTEERLQRELMDRKLSLATTTFSHFSGSFSEHGDSQAPAYSVLEPVGWDEKQVCQLGMVKIEPCIKPEDVKPIEQLPLQGEHSMQETLGNLAASLLTPQTFEKLSDLPGSMGDTIFKQQTTLLVIVLVVATFTFIYALRMLIFATILAGLGFYFFLRIDWQIRASNIATKRIEAEKERLSGVDAEMLRMLTARAEGLGVGAGLVNGLPQRRRQALQITDREFTEVDD
jgi:hypothetical protein